MPMPLFDLIRTSRDHSLYKFSKDQSISQSVDNIRIQALYGQTSEITLNYDLRFGFGDLYCVRNGEIDRSKVNCNFTIAIESGMIVPGSTFISDKSDPRKFKRS